MFYIKNFIFYFCFYFTTIFLAIIALPLLFFDKLYMLKFLNLWSKTLSFLIKHLFGITHQIDGNKVKKQVIYAIKHSSIWETIILPDLLHGNQAIVMKEELVNIPIIGRLFKHCDAISIDRSKKISSLKKLILSSEKAKIRGDSIIIFPEGSRSKNKNTYMSGIYSIYKSTNMSVIPIAHNTSKFWKNKFISGPGIINVFLLDEIKPGLEKNKFMELLQKQIETKSMEL